MDGIECKGGPKARERNIQSVASHLHNLGQELRNIADRLASTDGRKIQPGSSHLTPRQLGLAEEILILEGESRITLEFLQQLKDSAESTPDILDKGIQSLVTTRIYLAQILEDCFNLEGFTDRIKGLENSIQSDDVYAPQFSSQELNLLNDILNALTDEAAQDPDPNASNNDLFRNIISSWLMWIYMYQSKDY